MNILQNRIFSAGGKRSPKDKYLGIIAFGGALLGSFLSGGNMLWAATGAVVGYFVGIWAKKHDEKYAARD